MKISSALCREQFLESCLWMTSRMVLNSVSLDTEYLSTNQQTLVRSARPVLCLHTSHKYTCIAPTSDCRIHYNEMCLSCSSFRIHSDFNSGFGLLCIQFQITQDTLYTLHTILCLCFNIYWFQPTSVIFLQWLF